MHFSISSHSGMIPRGTLKKMTGLYFFFKDACVIVDIKDTTSSNMQLDDALNIFPLNTWTALWYKSNVFNLQQFGFWIFSLQYSARGNSGWHGKTLWKQHGLRWHSRGV
jgi:hypothetical protein